MLFNNYSVMQRISRLLLPYFRVAYQNRNFVSCASTQSLCRNNFRPQINLPRLLTTDTQNHNLDPSNSRITDLLDQLMKRRRVPMKHIEKTLSEITEEDQFLLLLGTFGKSMPNMVPSNRHKICQQIYKQACSLHKATLDIHLAYIQACTENRIVLDHEMLSLEIKDQLPESPLIFKALLKNVCERGDLEQAIKLLSVMKQRQIPIDESHFNSLLLAHTIKGGIEGAETVLQTIRAAQIPITQETIFQIFKGLAIKNDEDSFKVALAKYNLDWDEMRFLEILEEIGLHGNLSFLSEALKLGEKPAVKESSLKVDHLCISLVNMGQPEAAMTVYEALVEPTPDRRYGHFLLKEMLLCNTAAHRILKIASHIRHNDLNPFVIENTTEIALRLNRFKVALEFFEHFTIELRQHYFWPLLLNAGRHEGELAVINIIRYMLSKSVRPDSETLETYVIPFCSLNDPKLLMKSLQNLGLTVRELLSPILVVLLRNDQVLLAHRTCLAHNNVILQNDNLYNILPLAWKKSPKSRNEIVSILCRLCESNEPKKLNDLIGEFMVGCIKQCQSVEDFRWFLKLTDAARKQKLKIDQISADFMLNLINEKLRERKLSSSIKIGIENLQDFSQDKEDQHIMLHPNAMSLEELECHLIELKQKNMETRGVLRKLIQKHCQARNSQRITELIEEFSFKNYELSAGMKSSLMHFYTEQGLLDDALTFYEDLHCNHPQLKLDDFKVIDLATLLVTNGMYDLAIDMISQQSNKGAMLGDTSSIERNCRNLLSAIEDDENKQYELYQLLLKCNYCKPTNVILGMLVRTPLKRGNIERAIKTYIQFTKEYQQTPLQFEILCAALDQEDNTDLVRSVMEATARVHGERATQVAFIAALAEKNFEDQLREFLQTIKSVPVEDLKKRCDRWVQEEKVEPLLALERAWTEATRETADVSFVQLATMKVFSLKNDCDSAVAYYESLADKDQTISPALEAEYNNLLKKCKYERNNRFNSKQ